MRTRLLAFYVWFQSQPGHEETTAFFQREGEIVSELVALLQAESAVPEDLRTLALRALAVQLLDRTRHTPVISAISSGGQTSLLSMLMHKAVVSVTGDQTAASSAQAQYSMQFVEALLSLLGALVACSSGCAALSDAGVVPALLPLVHDTDASHINLVSAGVRILEAFMDFNAAAATVFRDLGGLQAMIHRLEIEVGHDTEQMNTDETTDVASISEPSQPSSSVAALSTSDNKLVPYSRRVLLKSLLRAVALASYHHGNGLRGTLDDQGKLFACLKIVIEHGQEFGGALFALAASVMSDLIHHDPLCFRTLEAAGLPESYLKAIQVALPYYPQAPPLNMQKLRVVHNIAPVFLTAVLQELCKQPSSITRSCCPTHQCVTAWRPSMHARSTCRHDC